MEKIDINDSEKRYQQSLDSLKQLSKRNEKLIRDFINANALGKTTLKPSRKVSAGVRARTKNIYLLKVAVKILKKDLDKLSEKDMEKFVKTLDDNKIKKLGGKNYSEQTKANVKKVLIMFLRYTLKDNKKYEKLTDWIATDFKKKEIPALMEDEVNTLLRGCNTLKQKVLIAVLFDSGARIEEFLNIRLGDIIEVRDGDMPYFRITIKEEYSKTKGRTLGLFWEKTYEILKDWLETHLTKNDLSSQLYPSTYAGTRKLLTKLGQRVLKKRVNPHLMRHSSATYYAGQGMDYFQLCKRYGWVIGSKVPQQYIDKSGIKEKEFLGKLENNKISDLQKEIQKLKSREKIMKEEIHRKNKMIDEEIFPMIQLMKEDMKILQRLK